MEIKTWMEQNVSVAELIGELDSKTAPEAQEKILPLAQSGCKLLLDMRNLTYMSSAGLRMLLLLYRQVSSKNGQIGLAGLRDEIRETMEMTGFLNQFKTYPTLQAGLQAVTV